MNIRLKLINKYISKLILWCCILILILFFTIPYIWMASSAFKPRSEIFAYIHPLSWRTFIPINPTFENFRTLLVEKGFWRPLLNSLGIAVTTVGITLLVSSMMAFALSRLKFNGRDLIFALVLATMMIPFEAIMVPMFLITQKLGLDNTYLGLFLPWIGDAFIIFLLRQQFLEIPTDIQDAAIMDGCNPFQIYWKIMMPLIKPALISAAFIKFMYSWDSYIWPLIITRDPQKMVVAVAIGKLFTDQDILWELIFAGSFIATIPIVILFIFLQRYYVEGITSTGLHGQ